MKKINFIALLIALFMMNIMYAELKTFGTPSDTETKEIPFEETPSEEAPSEETPGEETPGEETPGEETPGEETPVEEDIIPTASEDSEVNEDQPIKFKEEIKVSINLGTSMPFGANLKSKFTSGLNFQADVKTPFQFSGISILGHFSMFNLTASETDYTDYSVKNIGMKLSKEFSSFNIFLGSGLSLASGTTMYQPFEDYNMTSLFISGGISYILPLSNMLDKIQDGKFSDLNVAINLGGIEVFGAPSDSGTSDIIDMGISISYPFLF